MSDKQTTIHLLAGQRADGQLIFENVFATEKGDGCYQLLTSPIFARGAARLDTIRLLHAGRFEVEQHGGNLCVRVMAKRDLPAIVEQLRSGFTFLDGQLDYQNERIAVFSVPVIAGFSVIEAALEKVLEAYGDDAQWLYANVYDTEDGQTPLNWWHDFLAK